MQAMHLYSFNPAKILKKSFKKYHQIEVAKGTKGTSPYWWRVKISHS